MEQFIAMLGHEGCITAVVLSLIALEFSILVISILVHNLYDLRIKEREKVRAYIEAMQRMENRQAVYMELVTRGVDKDQAYQAVNHMRYS